MSQSYKDLIAKIEKISQLKDAVVVLESLKFVFSIDDKFLFDSDAENAEASKKLETLLSDIKANKKLAEFQLASLKTNKELQPLLKIANEPVKDQLEKLSALLVASPACWEAREKKKKLDAEQKKEAELSKLLAKYQPRYAPRCHDPASAHDLAGFKKRADKLEQEHKKLSDTFDKIYKAKKDGKPVDEKLLDEQEKKVKLYQEQCSKLVHDYRNDWGCMS